MSILDGLLGGNGNNAQESSSSHDFGTVVGTDPMVGTSVDNLLHSSQSDSGGGDNGFSDSSDFTGLGHLGFAAAAPTFVGISSHSDNSNASESHSGGGGLLNGLL